MKKGESQCASIADCPARAVFNVAVRSCQCCMVFRPVGLPNGSLVEAGTENTGICEDSV